jgi:hypothetical protein
MAAYLGHGMSLAASRDSRCPGVVDRAAAVEMNSVRTVTF